MNLPLSDSIRSQVDVLAKEGRNALLGLLFSLESREDAEEWARHAINALGNASPETFVDDVLDLAFRSESKAVLWRVRHWELDSLGYSLDALGVAHVVKRLRENLANKETAVRIRAAQALLSFGYRDKTIVDPLRDLANDSGLDFDDHITALRVAGFFGVLSSETMAESITAALSETDEATSDICRLIGFHGIPPHAKFLASHVNDKNFEPLMSLLTLAERYESNQDLQSYVCDVYVSAPPEIRFGLEGVAQRICDDPRIASGFLVAALDGLAAGHADLVHTNLLKRCNRPAQLEFLSHVVGKLNGGAINTLQSLITKSTPNAGVHQTSETFKKECAIDIAGRIGIPKLRSWIGEGVANEATGWLIKDLAEYCCFWEVKDFTVALAPRMQVIDDPSPMWLIARECGISGGAASIEALLTCEGRAKNTGDSALMTYVEGLAYGAVNEGDTALLTGAMNDSTQPAWRREAAAYAVRWADMFEPRPLTDWGAALTFTCNLSNDQFSRHELLIALAQNEPQLARQALKALPDEEWSFCRVLLSATISDTDLDRVKMAFERYKEPVQYPHQRNFDEQYAAICLARLYTKGLIEEIMVCLYLQNGLRHEVDSFFSKCESIRPEHAELAKLLLSAALEHNSRWETDEALWRELARLLPEQAFADSVFDHVLRSSDHAANAFIDVMLANAGFLENREASVWQFLSHMMFERGRAIAWHCAYAASVLCVAETRAFSMNLEKKGDTTIRTSLECAIWLDDEAWNTQKEVVKQAHWMDIEKYWDILSRFRSTFTFAEQYCFKVADSADLLVDWKFAQAVIELANERIVSALYEWQPKSLRKEHLRNWLLAKIAPEMKKAREYFWKQSRLPGEDSFPRAIE